MSSQYQSAPAPPPGSYGDGPSGPRSGFWRRFAAAFVDGLVLAIPNGGLYLIEPVLSVIFFLNEWDLPLNLMPSGATNAMLGVTSPVLFAGPHPFAWWQGALVLAGWCLAPAVIGVASTVRRDVT